MIQGGSHSILGGDPDQPLDPGIVLKDSLLLLYLEECFSNLLIDLIRLAELPAVKTNLCHSPGCNKPRETFWTNAVEIYFSVLSPATVIFHRLSSFLLFLVRSQFQVVGGTLEATMTVAHTEFKLKAPA